MIEEQRDLRTETAAREATLLASGTFFSGLIAGVISIWEGLDSLSDAQKASLRRVSYPALMCTVLGLISFLAAILISRTDPAQQAIPQPLEMEASNQIGSRTELSNLLPRTASASYRPLQID